MTDPKTIKVRKVNFKLEKGLIRHYFKNNIWNTHLANSLHIIFPEGEKFFIRTSRKFLKKIEDPQLKQDVKDFIGQEGTHSNEHKKFWRYLQEQNFNVKSFSSFFDSAINKMIEPTIYNLMGEDLGSKFCLSLVSGLEHYTALLAEVVFENENEFENMPQEMQHLIKWHAAEEIEHKAVAYDLLNHIDNSYLLRSSGFTTASILLIAFTLAGQLYFIANDEERDTKNLPRDFIAYMKSFGSPLVKKFFTNAFDYFRVDFHPNQVDNYDIAFSYFEKNQKYYNN